MTANGIFNIIQGRRPNSTPPGSSYLQELQDWVDYNEGEENALPTSERLEKINTFLTTLKTGGVLSLADLLYIMRLDNNASDASRVNIVSPGDHTCLLIDAPTFANNIGWQFDSSNDALNTQWIPATHGVNFTQNEAGIISYIPNDGGDSNGFAFGTNNISSGNQCACSPKNDTNDGFNYFINSSSINFGAHPTGSSIGLWHVKRTSPTATALFLNGEDVPRSSSPTNNSQGLATVPLYIGGRNNNNVQVSNAGPWSCGFYMLGSSFDGLEELISDAWAAFLAE